MSRAAEPSSADGLAEDAEQLAEAFREDLGEHEWAEKMERIAEIAREREDDG